MAHFLVCCRDAATVAGWLAAWLLGGRADATGVREIAPVVIWHVAGEGRGTPAVAGGTAFFMSKRHELIAIDEASGAVRWRRPTRGPGETTAGTTVLATPSHVIAGDGAIVAFTREGREAWRSRREEGSVGTYLGGLAGGRVFAGSSNGQIRAFDAATGVVRWSQRAAGDARTTVFAPVVDDAVVLAAFTAFDDLRRGGIVALDRESGRIRWRTELPRTARGEPRGVAGGPLVSDRHVLVASEDATIHALDRFSGRWCWSLPDDHGIAGGGHEFRTLILAGRTLVAGSLAGRITAYDLPDRRVRWDRAPMSASIVFGMATTDRTVYVPYLSGRLVALDVEQGAERWRTGAESSGFSWKPLVTADRILAASSSAGFFAFRL